MNERACIYRKQHGISDDLGTAANVQAMAFGNKGETSATGVAFTRNPADGTKEFYGDFLVNAQGEDVVAGIRNTEPIADLKTTPGLESAGEELERVFLTLEDHYRDMCDIEFTIEQGKLWMLQTRVGKRTATAALRIAIEMVEEGLITREEAVSRIDPAQLDQLLHPQFDASKKYEVLASGLNASPGAAVGEVVFSSDDAVSRANEGHKVILVRWETNPDDLKGMVAAEGILTSHGGKTSHAAVIARGMGTPCVCGVERFHIDAAEKVVRIEGSDRVLHEGDVISIDGTQGIVVDGAVDLVSAELTGDLDTILSWPTRFVWTRPTVTPTTCASTPTTPRMPSSLLSLAPRPSACAAPSICSWRSQEHHPELHSVRRRSCKAAGSGRPAQGSDRGLPGDVQDHVRSRCGRPPARSAATSSGRSP